MRRLPIAGAATAATLALTLLGGAPARADVVDFEDASLGGAMGPEQYWPVPTGGHATDRFDPYTFSSHGVTFSGYTGYDLATQYPYWGGWGYSNKTDTATRGFTNQHSAIAGAGAGGSATYGVLYGDAGGAETGEITIAPGMQLQGAYFTNTTYAYYEMLEGTGPPFFFAPALVDGDWVKMTVHGYRGTGDLIGAVDFFLADYRGPDYLIVDTWTWLDLSSLADAQRLTFSFDENKKADYGPGLVFMNHPSYIVMDNLTFASQALVPEPSACVLAALAAALVLGWRATRWR